MTVFLAVVLFDWMHDRLLAVGVRPTLALAIAAGATLFAFYGSVTILSEAWYHAFSFQLPNPTFLNAGEITLVNTFFQGIEVVRLSGELILRLLTFTHALVTLVFLHPMIAFACFCTLALVV